MEFTIQFSKPALESLERIPKNYKDRIVDAIKHLKHNQHPHGNAKLEDISDCYRIRIGDYRLIYSIRNDILIVLIVAIGQRKDIYNKRSLKSIKNILLNQLKRGE
jgi:mRNA interferase RelE/StbE